MVDKLGFRLVFTLEETEYYETLLEMYADILDILKETND